MHEYTHTHTHFYTSVATNFAIFSDVTQEVSGRSHTEVQMCLIYGSVVLRQAAFKCLEYATPIHV